MPTRQLVVGAVVSAVAGWLLWSLLDAGYLGDYWLWPLLMATPDGYFQSTYFVIASWTYYALVLAVIVMVFGRLGNWPEVLKRVGRALAAPAEDASGARAAGADPAQWPQLRADGAVSAADRLTADLHAGRMTDVDQARIAHAWRSGRARAEITSQVLAAGAAALAGPGGRDLPDRVGQHDLSVRQVRIGTAVDDRERNPHPYRGVGVALDPTVLGTSAVVVGPDESAAGVMQPVVESLCLQALAGQAVLITVTSARTPLVPGWYDVVAGAATEWGLDLYGGVDDLDTAAGILAEALTGDLAALQPEGDGQRTATALALLLGPWRALHGRFPNVAELRDLVEGEAGRAVLRAAAEAQGAAEAVRDLDAYERRSGAGAGVLADRLMLLDRPAVRAVLASGPEAGGRRVLRLRDLVRPVRVRIELPEGGHREASRMLARLVLGHFLAGRSAREQVDVDVFAALVVDDGARLITAEALRGVQQLRAHNAGVLVRLRTLADVPEALRSPLLGAVGCRIACAGMSPADGRDLASVWGTEWVETRTVTHRQVRAEEPLGKVLHALRRVVTGKPVTAESVTVRSEERPRWSASALANEMPAGHVVLSLATVDGQRTPPILTRV
ncbi:ATP-binding protein [Streptomyces echinatus]|uniref:ATP-binding protein n=1 Tax=Streptomyces echinatus TaxID=67293 RepID=UPI003825347F